MTLNRRRFINNSALLCAVALVSLPETGCSGSEIENELNVVLQEAVNVLAVVDPNAPWVPQLQKAITTLKTAEATWTGGGAVNDLISALNTIVAITGAIPLTAPYAPLIGILVAAIEAVMAALPKPTINMSAEYNQFVGKTTIPHHFGRSRAYDFKSAWNKAANADPTLKVAVIK